jgi:hypothetical protein
MDNIQMATLLDDVKTKYLPKSYDQNILDHLYGKMVHDDKCDYDPFKVP